MVKKAKLTWSEIHALCETIVAQVNESGFKPDIVMGISRGGVVPATMIAHQLQVTPFYAVQLTSYDIFGMQTSVKVIDGQTLPYFPKRSKVLIIDEICDSGETIAFLKAAYNIDEQDDIRIATLVTKTHKAHKDNWPHYTANQTKEPSWIIFPWEGPCDDEVSF